MEFFGGGSRGGNFEELINRSDDNVEVLLFRNEVDIILLLSLAFAGVPAKSICCPIHEIFFLSSNGILAENVEMSYASTKDGEGLQCADRLRQKLAFETNENVEVVMFKNLLLFGFRFSKL